MDPANRLVADELERRWNTALERSHELEDQIKQKESHQKQIVPPELKTFQDLTRDFERVWNHPSTDVRLKKRLARTLIEEIIVTVDSEAGEVMLVVHWAGGIHTELRFTRRRRGQNGSQTSKDIVNAVGELTRICSDRMIAGLLNRNGRRTGRGNRWISQHVTSLRSHHKITKYSSVRRAEEGWMNLTEAAKYLGVSAKTLRLAVERSEIKAMHPLPFGPWVFKREDLDHPKALKVVQRVQRHRQDPAGPTPEQLNLFESTT